MFGEPKLSMFCGEEEVRGPSRSSNVGQEGVWRQETGGQGSGGD